MPGFAVIPALAAAEGRGDGRGAARLQTLSWMQRPVVVRTWLATAIAQSRFGRLSDLSADALRLSCGLLDSPLPPELVRHYIVLPADAKPG